MLCLSRCVVCRGVDLSKEQVRRWYESRACEIEQLSGQVDGALQLIELAIEKSVKVGLVLMLIVGPSPMHEQCNDEPVAIFPTVNNGCHFFSGKKLEIRISRDFFRKKVGRKQTSAKSHATYLGGRKFVFSRHLLM